MKMSVEIDKLAEAFAKAQGEMPNAKKESDNPYFHSRYADLAACIDAVRNPLAANGLAVMQSPSLLECGKVRMTTLLLHSSGQWIESDPLDASSKDTTPQAVGSIITYLRRYSLQAHLGLGAEDDDGNVAQGFAQEAKTDQKKTRPQQRAKGAKPVDDRMEPAKESHSKYSEAASRIMAWTGTPDQWQTFKGKVRTGIIQLEADGDLKPGQAEALEEILTKRDEQFAPKEEPVPA